MVLWSEHYISMAILGSVIPDVCAVHQVVSGVAEDLIGLFIEDVHKSMERETGFEPAWRFKPTAWKTASRPS